jgi:hypothetical protein
MNRLLHEIIRVEHLYHRGMPGAAPALLDHVPFPAFTGLRALVGALGTAVLLTEGLPTAIEPGSVPLALVRRNDVDIDVGPLSAHLRAGGRAVVAVTPSTATTLDALLPLTTPARRPATAVGQPHLSGADPSVLLPIGAGARPLAAADPSDPLVFDSRLVASGRGPAFANRSLAADDFVPVGPLGGSRRFEVGGSAVVTEIAVGAGTLVVVGSVGFLGNRWIAATDNALFLTWALTGRLDPEAARVARDHRPVTTSTHAPVPVVRATAGPDLLTIVPPADTPVGSRAFLSAAGRAGRLLPADVHDALVELVDVGNDAGALLIRRLPVGDVPATPSTPVSPTGKDRVSELVLLAAARRLGQPVGYQPEHGGDIVQNLLPTRAHADRQTSTSSNVQLEFHTETAFHRHKPRFLLLLCLRGDPEALTLLCSIRSVIGRLPLGVRRTLSEPRFRTGVDESFTGTRNHRLGRPVPVLEGTTTEPTLTFDADLMVGLDDEARAALGELRQVIRAGHVAVALEAGDLLVVDNAVSVHGRSPFAARFDGTDRWLQRTFVVADLAASAGERVGRVITTRFDD